MYKYLIEEEGLRLDVYLTKLLKDYSRSKIKELFKKDNVLINGEAVKPSYLVRVNDELIIKEFLKEEEIEAKNLNLEIVYEDDYLLIINKPKGILTHPSSNLLEDSVVNHLKYYTKNLSNIYGEERLGIVHRLDKDTSGLMIIAKNNEVHELLTESFKNRTIKKVYEALVLGSVLESSGTINAPILRDPISKVKMVVSSDGKEALTHFEVLNKNDFYSHLSIDLITGRTHQIRVHLAYINYPLVGDKTYGKKDDFNDSFYLHAKELSFVHPITKESLTIKKEAPKEFLEAYHKLFDF